MSYLRTIYIKNGDFKQPFNIYKCDECGCEIDESQPSYYDNKTNYCLDCAFKLSLIDSERYLCPGTGFDSKMCKAGINPITNEIEIIIGRGKFSWEKTNKDHRQSPEYSSWRTEVFERDKYTCRKCGKKGGELNAHHIEHFSKNKKKRFDIDNGITLCKSCHNLEHKTRKVV